MKKLILFLLLSFLFIHNFYFISAKDQSVQFIYNSSINNSFENSLDFSDVLVKVATNFDAHCKYSLSKGVSYENMEMNLNYQLYYVSILLLMLKLFFQKKSL